MDRRWDADPCAPVDYYDPDAVLTFPERLRLCCYAAGYEAGTGQGAFAPPFVRRRGGRGGRGAAGGEGGHEGQRRLSGEHRHARLFGGRTRSCA